MSKTRGWWLFVGSALTGFVFGLAANSRYLKGTYDWAAVALGVVAAVTLVVLPAGLFLRYRAFGPLAVEVFLLDPDNRLLLYHHPFHQCRMPPGGKVGFFEHPHEAVVRTLRDRVGLEPGTYELLPLHPTAQPRKAFKDVKPLPCPFRVQSEIHPQRRFKKNHVDYFYFGRAKTSQVPENADSDYEPVEFVDRPRVKDLKSQKALPPDVLDAYDAILAVLKGK